MIVVDITRIDKKIENDLIMGNLSVDTLSKTINYIYDYALANLNIEIDKELLDSKLNLEFFSLKDFIKENYNIKTNQDLIIHSARTDKEHCLFLKYYDNKNEPTFFIFNNNDIKKAEAIRRYLVNDYLLEKYQDNLQKYDELRITNNSKNISKKIKNLNINCEITPLNNGAFLETLLNNVCSLKQINNKNNLIKI